MDSRAKNGPVRERRVIEAIAAYLTAVDAGQAPDPDAFIGDYLDIADDLKSFFADRDRFERRFASPLPNRSPMPHCDQLDAMHETCKPSDASPIHNVPPMNQGAAFGDYELLEELGRGGMGVVYKARQLSLNRIVALKMILAGQLASKEDVQRFRTEAEAAANLDHPGIVPVYDVGVYQGQHYFSMGYVNGCSLAHLLRVGPLAARTAAELLAQVCDAVHCAHERQLLHRDLKPANILLDYGNPSDVGSESSRASIPVVRGETGPMSDVSTILARPRITDFGLAKRLEQDSALTLSGQLLGDTAPILNGLLWASALLTFGMHYYRLGRAAQSTKGPG